MVPLFLPTQKKEAEGLPNVRGWVLGQREQQEKKEYFETNPERLRKEVQWGRKGRLSAFPLPHPTPPSLNLMLNLPDKPVEPSKGVLPSSTPFPTAFGWT